MTAPTIWEHLLAVLLGLVGPAFLALQHLRRRASSEAPSTFDTVQKIALYVSNSLFLWLFAGAVLAAWLFAGRSLRGLGLCLPLERLSLGLILGLAFIAAYALDTWWQLSTPQRLATTRLRWRRDTPFMPATAQEIRWALVLVTSAAMCEEIVYRGFLVGYLAFYMGSSAAGLSAAVALPALVFAACHFYQGLHAVVKIALLSCIFGAILIVTGSLWIPIALHFLVDLTGSLLGPTLLKSDGVVPERNGPPAAS